MAQTIVGLDLGSYTVRAARLRVGFRNMELEDMVARGVDDDPWPAIAAAVKGADVVFSTLPGDQVSFRQLEFPRAAAKRLDQIIPFELDGELPFELETLVIHHRVMDRTADKLQILAAATQHERVADLLSELSTQGINPREVVPAPLCLVELARMTAPEGTAAVVDVGHGRTDITISVEGEFKSARTVSFGGRDVTTALARAFGAPEEVALEWKHSETYLYEGDREQLEGDSRIAADAVAETADRLVRELRQTLVAHELDTGGSVDKLVLCGGGSRLGGLPEYLSDRLGLPVERFDVPPDTIGGADEADVVAGAKALALAIHGAAHRSRRINLRQADLAFEGEARAGAGVMVYALVAVLLIMLAWGFSAYARHASLSSQDEAQHEALVSRTKRLLGRELDSFDMLERLMSQSTKTKTAESPIPERDAFDVVEAISERIPEKINHEIDTLDIRSGRVQIQGRVDQRRDADEIESALSQWDECFNKVQVTRTTPAVRDKRLQYTLDIESRCP